MDRFDFEQQIMQCWNVVDEIRALNQHVSEECYTQDWLQNYLLGLETIYQLKFDKLFQQFEQLVRNKEI